MFIPDPATTTSILKTIGELFKRLREHQNNKEVFDIVRDLQTEQSKLEDRMKDAEAEVTRLNETTTKLKETHAAEIAQLKQAHADEIKRMTAMPGRVIPLVEDGGYGFGDLGQPL